MQVVAHRPTTTGVLLWIQAELAESDFLLEVHELATDEGRSAARACWRRTGSPCDDHEADQERAATGRDDHASHWCPAGRDPDQLLPNVVPWSSDTRIWWQELTGLVPGRHHAVRFRPVGDVAAGVEGSDVATFRTLPETVRGGRPLKLLLASCYCEDRDNVEDAATRIGRLADTARLHRGWRPLFTPLRRFRHARAAWRSFRRHGPVAEDPGAPQSRVVQAFRARTDRWGPPDVTVLMGDQVYLDAPIHDFWRPMGEGRTKRHISRTYSRTWEKLGPLLSTGANFFLTDDHEFWNNYPANPLFWLALTGRRTGRRWELHARQFLQAVQAPMAFHTVDIGTPREVTFCLVDTRMHRERPTGVGSDRFMRDADFTALLDWIAELDVPGVLVIGQPVVADGAGWRAVLDRGLPDHPEQYRRLCLALADAKHDVLVLTGDIHFARYTRIDLHPRPAQGRTAARLHELVVSPLTLVPGAGNRYPTPAPTSVFPRSGVPLGTATYTDPLPGTTDESRGRHWWSRWRRDVCRDHFMTLEVSVSRSGTVDVRAAAHLIRPEDSQTQPPPEFVLPVISLR